MTPPSDPIDFFAEPKAVSLHKLDLFGKYLKPLTWKLGSGWRNIWIVDGFAGSGAYETGQPGSPRLAAVWAREEEVRRGYPLVRCINVERDPECFEQIERNLSPWKHLVTNLPGAFADRLDEILDQIGHDPAFFFLDPFGVNGIEMEVVEKILGRQSRKTEILLHFSDRSFKRMAGHSDEDDGRSSTAIKLAESKLSRLDAVVGTPLWRPRWAGEVLDTDAAMEATAQLYLSQLRERGFRYVHQIRMRHSFQARPRFRLVFCTESPHGVELMSDMACVYERSLWDGAHEGTFDLVLAEDARAHGDARLRDLIHEAGLAAGTATRQQIVHTLAPRLFGEYRTSDYAKAIRELVASGGIDRPSPKGIEEKEELRFVALAQQSLLGGLNKI
jgi:three-Cys-motif partner protein